LITDSEVALNDEISTNVPKRTEQGRKLDSIIQKSPGSILGQEKHSPRISTPKRSTATVKNSLKPEDGILAGS